MTRQRSMQWIERHEHGAILHVAVGGPFADRLSAFVAGTEPRQKAEGPNQLLASCLVTGLDHLERRLLNRPTASVRRQRKAARFCRRLLALLDAGGPDALRIWLERSIATHESAAGASEQH